MRPDINQNELWTISRAVEDDAEHIGGVTLFGKTFGNYGQDIRVAINYCPIK